MSRESKTLDGQFIPFHAVVCAVNGIDEARLLVASTSDFSGSSSLVDAQKERDEAAAIAILATVEVSKLKAKLEDAKDVLKLALAHVQELRDAWERGAITEHDGKGGTRSNRNATVDVEIRKVLDRLNR